MGILTIQLNKKKAQYILVEISKISFELGVPTAKFSCEKLTQKMQISFVMFFRELLPSRP